MEKKTKAQQLPQALTFIKRLTTGAAVSAERLFGARSTPRHRHCEIDNENSFLSTRCLFHLSYNPPTYHLALPFAS